MKTARWRLLGATGAAAVAVFAVLPNTYSDGWYHVVALTLLPALAALLYRDRRTVGVAWWLLAGALAVLVATGALEYVEQSPGIQTAQIVLLTAGSFAMAAAAVRFIAARTNLKDVDGAIDVVVLSCAIGVVLWEFVARRHVGDAGLLSSPLAVALFPGLQSVTMALAVRFLFWGTWRLTAGLLLFAATTSVSAGNVAYVVGYNGGSGVPRGVAGAAWLLGLLLFVLAAAHRSRAELTRAALPGLSKVPYARLALMGSALVASPALVFAYASEYSAGLVPAIGSLVLTVSIVARVFRVVIERETARTEIRTRAEQQIALVDLGQRALAGSEIARLFDEATVAVAATMNVDYAGIFEPAGAETLLLRAAVGWEMADSQRTTVSTAEPFFGVPLVAGAPGYLDSERHGHSAAGCALLTKAGATSGLSVTIGTPAQRYGVLAVATRATRSFTADDVTFLRSVANVLTAAIERSRTENEVRIAALHDPLTGLPNRVLLLDRLESALGRARRQGGQVAVMFVDLDGFKQVNDTFGHRAGDQLLVAVSRRLQNVLRPEDTLARLAGDEFVVVSERVDEEATIESVAGRIVETLQEPFVLDDGTAAITASVGVSLGTGHGDDVDQLLRDADTAMYRAKKAGKSRFELAVDESPPAARTEGARTEGARTEGVSVSRVRN